MTRAVRIPVTVKMRDVVKVPATADNAALEAARQGWLGEVYLVRGVINTNISGDSRRSFGEIAGGTMYELGCHLIDPLVRLLGKHAKVTPVLRHDAKDADALADNCVAVFDFKHAIGIISSATMQPTSGAHRTFEIQGTNGVAIVRPLEQPVLTVDLAKDACPYNKGSQVINFPPYARYVPEFAELAACVRSGKPLAVTPEEDELVHEALLVAWPRLAQWRREDAEGVFDDVGERAVFRPGDGAGAARARTGHGESRRPAGALARPAQGKGRPVRRADRVLARRAVPVPLRG